MEKKTIKYSTGSIDWIINVNEFLAETLKLITNFSALKQADFISKQITKSSTPLTDSNILLHTITCNSKKNLKTPKGQSETVYRRTDNTMAKRKSTKGQTTIGKTYI